MLRTFVIRHSGFVIPTMDSQARVHSLSSIESVRTALLAFVDQAGDALTELESEMRRVQDWLEHDRPRYWKTQVRLSIDQVHEAQQALQRCLMFPVANERPSCTEERMALKKAQARQSYCERKVERVRHWQQVVRHELFEYEGRISQMVRLVEADVPQAIGMLGKILRQLEEYQSIRASDPRAAYNDISFARELWPDGEAAASGEEKRDGEDASGGQDVRETRKNLEQGEE
jgi:exonuclease VII large subunit